MLENVHKNYSKSSWNQTLIGEWFLQEFNVLTPWHLLQRSAIPPDSLPRQLRECNGNATSKFLASPIPSILSVQRISISSSFQPQHRIARCSQGYFTALHCSAVPYSALHWSVQCSALDCSVVKCRERKLKLPNNSKDNRSAFTVDCTQLWTLCSYKNTPWPSVQRQHFAREDF